MELKKGYKQTEIGELPEDWHSVKLGDLGKWKGGATPSMANQLYWKNGEIPWVSSGDVKKNRLIDTSQHITDIAVKQTSTSLLPINSIIFVVRSGILRKYLPVALTLVQTAINQDIKGLIVLGQNTVYLLHMMIYSGDKILSTCLKSGTTVESIEYSWLKSFVIPLPPLLEQQAIAAALSDTDALITSLEKLIGKKRNIKQGAMQELLTGKRRLAGFSGEWVTKKLGELGSFLKGKGIRKDEVLSDGIPCIRYGEIYTTHDDYIKCFASYISHETALESQKINFGDLLFAGSGETAEEIGKCVAFIGHGEAYAGGDIVIFSPIGMNSLYLGYLMNRHEIVIQKAKMGQGDAVVHISAKNLGEVIVYIPPINEQDAIVEVITDMDAEIDALEKKLNKYCAIKQGMMQELLTGKTRLV